MFGPCTGFPFISLVNFCICIFKANVTDFENVEAVIKFKNINLIIVPKGAKCPIPPELLKAPNKGQHFAILYGQYSQTEFLTNYNK